VRLSLLLLAVLLVGCGDAPPLVSQGESRRESGLPCMPPSPVPGPLPSGLPAPPTGSLLTLVAPGTASGRVEAPLDDVVAHFKAVFDSAGYVVQREEDEGRAVRLAFFGAGGDASLTVATQTCPAGTTGFTLAVRRATP
jgi:hypothetical protein